MGIRLGRSGGNEILILMDRFEVVIIGAGVIGLAIAQDISRKESNVLVLERNNSFGLETSSRNSEVIHGGMYYPAGSLKATLCIEGRRMLYGFCQQHRVAVRKTGKLIVATENEESSALNEIFNQGLANGVEGLHWLSSNDLKRLEPHVKCVMAIFSEETGIIDSHEYMKCLLDIAQANGVIIAYNSEAVGIRKHNERYKLTVNNNKEILDIFASRIINCAGLDADNIAAMVNIDIKASGYELYYCKGQYFRVASKKSGLLSHLVYPVPLPKSGGLGIHATLDLAGSLRLGPDDSYLKERVKDYSVNPKSIDDFYDSAVKFMPFLSKDDLSADTSGIRPKLQSEGGDFRDFVICEETDKGLPGFINLIGIESPGLTASLAISKHVGNLINH